MLNDEAGRCREGYTAGRLRHYFVEMLENGDDEYVPFGLQIHLGDCLACSTKWQEIESEIVGEVASAATFGQWKEARQRINRHSQDVDEILSTVRNSTGLRNLALKFKGSTLALDRLYELDRDLRRLCTTRVGEIDKRLPDSVLAVLSECGALERRVFLLQRFIKASLFHQRLLFSITSEGDFQLHISEYLQGSQAQLKTSDAEIAGPR